jgi:hypothetical protein
MKFPDGPEVFPAKLMTTGQILPSYKQLRNTCRGGYNAQRRFREGNGLFVWRCAKAKHGGMNEGENLQ